MKRTEGVPPNGAGRTRPLVWVRRLLLYETIEPIGQIREINFSTGLNIIQVKFNEKDDSFESGHGIGKTTVCRLIRYCLGEKTFGQKHFIEEVKHCFPTLMWAQSSKWTARIGRCCVRSEIEERNGP